MKRLKGIYSAVLVICAILLAASCEKRPLLDLSNTHYVRVYVDENLLNVTKGFYDESYEKPAYKSPGILRVTLTDPESGIVKAERYLRDQGYDEKGRYYEGYIIADPGEYQLMAYNFDTESTIIGSSNNRYEINAYTNPIASHLYTKIPSRVKSQTDESKGEKLSKIVYDPDHLFVGRLNDVFIPARSVDAPPVILNVTCETVVESWILEARTVTGKENIGTIAAVITSLSESNKIGPNIRSDEFVSVYFDNQVIDENGLLTARFDTFGWHPGITEPQVLSLVFTDIAGNGHVYNFDVSNQFPDNKEQIIRVQAEIDIPKPMTDGDGGFVPKVDEWEEINTDIII